jgi:hypothetical protein
MDSKTSSGLESHATPDLPRHLSEENQYLKDHAAISWARFDYWQLWEAMLLVAGLCPQYFEQLERYNRRMRGQISEEEAFAAISLSPIEEAAHYYSPSLSSDKLCEWFELYDVLSRSESFRDSKVNPSDFVAWAKLKRLPVPEILEAALNDINGPLPVWGYEERYYPDDADRPQIALDGPKWIKHPPAHFLDPMDSQIQRHAANDSTAKITDELLPKERDSLLKLVIGMAVEQYGYDPKAARNDATANIETDLRNLGIPLDRNTILKWVRAGAELLPDQSAI